MEEYNMALNKFFDKLTGVDGPEDNENEKNEVTYVAEEKKSNNNKMILLEPRAYSEAQQIADYLKANSAVVVNLKRVTPDQAKRIVDFLSGTLYAIEGNLQKLGGGIFLCAPGSIDVEGTISDDGTKPKTKKEEEEDFNW
jgi:cell division inhibitor SepF